MIVQTIIGFIVDFLIFNQRHADMSLKVIDWAEALENVGGDRDFLREVLQDLLLEAGSAEVDMSRAMQEGDLIGVSRAAHRIKGGASYLCCDMLKAASQRLVDVAQAPSTVGALLEAYRAALSQLRIEVSSN